MINAKSKKFHLEDSQDRKSLTIGKVSQPAECSTEVTVISVTEEASSLVNEAAQIYCDDEILSDSHSMQNIRSYGI
jgi:hypothetical protein